MLTPQTEYEKLASNIEVNRLFLKREDLHPLGSHKGRSIPVMIDRYISQGSRHFAISSSGNAALAAGLYARKIGNIKLEILVGQNISTRKLNKLKELENENIAITMHDRPLQTLNNKIRDGGIISLRQSTDNTALLGYRKLAEELLEIPDLEAVFIGTSSGTTAEALSQYFKDKDKKIEVHIVQTSSCHPIAEEFYKNDVIDEDSIADAIVDKTAIRKKGLVKILKGTNGNGWIVSNEEINIAQELTEKYAGIKISTNSALSVAGLMQAIYTGQKWKGSVVCMICGD